MRGWAVLVGLAGWLVGWGRGQRLCAKGWLYVNDECWKYERVALPFDAASRQCRSQVSPFPFPSLPPWTLEWSVRMRSSPPSTTRRRTGSRTPSSRSTASPAPSPPADASATRPSPPAPAAGPARAASSSVRRRRRTAGAAEEEEEEAEAIAAQPAVDVSCFDLVSNAVLFGFTEVAIQKANVDACKRECLDSTRLYSFECKSIMWYPETLDCLLNSRNRSPSLPALTQTPHQGSPMRPRFDPDARDLFQVDTFGERVDYYDQNCDGFPPPGPVPTTRGPFTGPLPPPLSSLLLPFDWGQLTGAARTEGCYRVFENAILVGYADEVIDGITLEECQTECSEAEVRTFPIPWPWEEE